MVLNQDGIFSRAEKATDKYGQSKSRETLELALGEAQMQKYEQGLTDLQLDNKINEIGELLPKEKPDHPELQNVIVDGHIFEIDRSVPKIVDYIGPADGVVITATITQNGDWKNPVATVKGTITKYGGGTVTSSSATATNGVTITGFPSVGGSYTISNITTDTDITITASADDGKPAVTKTIQVRLVKDNTAPTLSNAKVEVGSHMKMKISVTATDTESGVAQINYKITPETLDSTTPAEGTLESGKEKEIITTAEGEYTVTFTATDNAGNTTEPGVTVTATMIDGITVAEAKEITQETIRENIGKKVIDYNPPAGGTYRVFYYDPETADYPKGYFGDGDGTGPRSGTVYLKRDEGLTMQVDNHQEYESSDGRALMGKLNPKWRDNPNDNPNSGYEKLTCCVSYFFDPSVWSDYKASSSSYAVGACSLELFLKSYGLRRLGDDSAKVLDCGVTSTRGYFLIIDGVSYNPGQDFKNNFSLRTRRIVSKLEKA